MSKEQVRMMNARDKLVEESQTPLTRLFRLLLGKMEIGPEKWNTRLTLFLKSPLSRVRKTAKDIGQERNNFNRAIAKRDVTWKTFQKAVQIIGPKRYSMSITMELKDGSLITVETPMGKNPYSDMDSLQIAVAGGMNSSSDITNYDADDADDTDFVTHRKLNARMNEIVLPEEDDDFESFDEERVEEVDERPRFEIDFDD